MIATDCPCETAATSTVDSPTALALALVRVFIWETSEHAVALGRFLRAAGHPFVIRRGELLPPAVRPRSSGGQVFELFTLPVDLGLIIDAINGDVARHQVETLLDFSDLPSLMLARKSRPIDTQQPELEFRCVLDLLPTWRPDIAADLPKPAPPATPTPLPFALRAPFVLNQDTDEDAIGLPGSYRARLR